MRPKILAVQFRRNQDSCEQEQAAFVREGGIYADIEFVNALNAAIDWHEPSALMAQYHGMILGGSGDFDFDGGRTEADIARQQSYHFLEQLRPLFQYLFDNDTPTLGICYGHQLLGAFAGAQVRSDVTQKKTRSHPVKLLIDKNDYFLFADLPDTFYAQYGHKDSLDRVPEGAILLMQGGDQCKVSALRYKNNIYTTQFHPELTLEDMLARMHASPDYLPEGVVAAEVFKASPDANRILRNFGKFVAMQAERSLTA